MERETDALLRSSRTLRSTGASRSRKEVSREDPLSPLRPHRSTRRLALQSESVLSLCGEGWTISFIPTTLTSWSSIQALSGLQEKAEEEDKGEKGNDSGDHKNRHLLEHLEQATNPQCRQ